MTLKCNFIEQQDTCNVYSDATQTGFCTNFCGWHDYYGSCKYAWIGVSPSGCACFPQSVSPNGNAPVYAVVSVIAHELAETVTHPINGCTTVTLLN